LLSLTCKPFPQSDLQNFVTILLDATSCCIRTAPFYGDLDFCRKNAISRAPCIAIRADVASSVKTHERDDRLLRGTTDARYETMKQASPRSNGIS